MYRFFLTCLRACTIFDLFNKFFHLFFELICVARFGFYTRKQQKQQKTSSLVVLVPPPPHCRLCNFNHEFYWPLLNVRTIWRKKKLCEIFRIDCVYHHSNEKALNKLNFHHSVNWIQKSKRFTLALSSYLTIKSVFRLVFNSVKIFLLKIYAAKTQKTDPPLLDVGDCSRNDFFRGKIRTLRDSCRTRVCRRAEEPEREHVWESF